LDTKYPQFGLKAVANKVNNLPLPLRNVNIVVSRECVRAINEIARRLLGRNGLKQWLQYNGYSLKKFRHISVKNMRKKWPELKQWFDEHIPEEEHHEFLRELRRYVGRTDIWSPGPRIRDKQNKVIACKGLIRIDDVVM
jgi:hypothetical protein